MSSFRELLEKSTTDYGKFLTALGMKEHPINVESVKSVWQTYTFKSNKIDDIINDFANKFDYNFVTSPTSISIQLDYKTKTPIIRKK